MGKKTSRKGAAPTGPKAPELPTLSDSDSEMDLEADDLEFVKEHAAQLGFLR